MAMAWCYLFSRFFKIDKIIPVLSVLSTIARVNCPEITSNKPLIQPLTGAIRNSVCFSGMFTPPAKCQVLGAHFCFLRRVGGGAE
jgi:hypothetical protein